MTDQNLDSWRNIAIALKIPVAGQNAVQTPDCNSYDFYERFRSSKWKTTVTTDQRQRIITRLNGRTQLEAFEAAKAIWQDPDSSLERPLVSTLKNGRRPFNRAAAAYAMQILRTSKTVRALEATVECNTEHPRVRGEAAEALAHGHRKRSHDVLLRGLGDPSRDVRFWCAFALGEMAERRAIAILKDLVATDKRIVRGWHSVAKEAADALNNIKAARKDWRKGRCAFCVRN